METILNWKKGIFKDHFEIFSQGALVGSLKEKTWKQVVYGKLNGKKVVFKTHGFFKQETQIIDQDTNLLLGKITYNSWMTKATIEFANKVFNWKYENVWNTKWSIGDKEGMKILYQGSSSKGVILDQTQDDLLILSGLFVTNYYWQSLVVIMIAIIVPIIATMRHV